MAKIRRVHAANFGVYGVPEVWRQLGRKGIVTARCTVARLMRTMGLAGWCAGARSAPPFPIRQRPARSTGSIGSSGLHARTGYGSRFYLRGHMGGGFVYVAFVIDVFARRIVGWRVSRSARAEFVLDAPKQTLHERRPFAGSGLVCHSGRGLQYVST